MHCKIKRDGVLQRLFARCPMVWKRCMSRKHARDGDRLKKKPRANLMLRMKKSVWN